MKNNIDKEIVEIILCLDGGEEILRKIQGGEELSDAELGILIHAGLSTHGQEVRHTRRDFRILSDGCVE